MPAPCPYGTCAIMVLLAAEQGLATADIAPIVREDRSTVWRWLKRCLAEGVDGL